LLSNAAVFQLLNLFVKTIQPYLEPICFFCAWLFLGLLVWSVLSALQDGLAKARNLHRIPCADCQYFTRDYHLKCTVHPAIALSEDAIGCTDYCPDRNPFTHSLPE